MFQQLIEAIRTESSQSGSRKERTPGEGVFRHGPMTDHGQKQAELKADKKKRRRMGKAAAAAGNDEFNVGRPGGKKVPQHAPKRHWNWSTKKGRHSRLMRRDEGIQDLASKGMDKILPRRAEKKAKRKAKRDADSKRRDDNYARSQENLRKAVARIKTRY